MRILLVSDLYRPSVGGTERHVEELANALEVLGHHVTVATTSPALDAVDPPNVHRIGGWATVAIRRRARPEQHFHPPAADPGVVRRLVERCREDQIEIIHAHGWIAHSAIVAARRCDVPLVVGLHDYGLDCARRSRLLPDGRTCDGPSPAGCRACGNDTYGRGRGELVVRGLRRSARWWDDVDAFVANSEAVASAARAAGVDCTVASPWVAPRQPGQTIVGGPVPNLPAAPFVLYAGAQARHKGIATLTAAWEPVAPAPLVALLSRPETEPPALPPGTFEHRGASLAQVLATMARAALVVVPSIFPEPFGLVATEAMSVGTPVIASAVGGLPHVVDHGQAGVLVPPGDPQALRSAIIDLLAHPERRAALASQGTQRAAQLDGTKAILDVYAEVLSGQPQALPPSLRT